MIVAKNDKSTMPENAIKLGFNNIHEYEIYIGGRDS